MLLSEDEFDIWRDQDFSIFLNEEIKYLAVDTRDFHSLCSKKGQHPQQSLSKIKKYPERFFFTRQEVVDVLNRLKKDKPGKNMLYIGEPKFWLKYIYIWETPYGFTMNSNERALTKELLNSTITSH